MLTEAVVCSGECVQIRVFRVRPARRPPAGTAGHPLAGITGYGRLVRRFQADSRAGSTREAKKRRSTVPRLATEGIICSEFTGATGLEPATSGVTDRSRR